MNKIAKKILLLAATQLCVMLLPAQNNFPLYKGPFSGKTQRLMDSAIDLIKEAKGHKHLYFKLSEGIPEEVTLSKDSDFGENGLVLTADASPTTVDIDGSGRVIELAGAPSGNPLVTVGNGVTLTLWNITLKGLASNTAPLIMVKNGGTLILREGAVIKDNENGSGNGGGVYVDSGGTFNMTGGELSGNLANRGGGVYVAKDGIFRKTGGSITSHAAITGYAAGNGSVAAAHGGTKYRDLAAGQDVNLYFGPNVDASDSYPDFDLKDSDINPSTGAGDTELSWLPLNHPFSNSKEFSGSVIDQIRAAAGQPNVTIALDFCEEETVSFVATEDFDTTGLVLTTTDNPADLTIVGGRREVTLGTQSGHPLITVESGVTLTLHNITFKGIDGNIAPIIMVKSGGMLILQEGAVIKGNENGSGDGGGVYVESGGVLNMTGGEISGNSANRGGGVYVAKGGTFRKTGGSITGNSAVIGRVAAAHAGAKYRDLAAGQDVNLYFGPNVNASDSYPDFDLKDPDINPSTGAGNTEFNWQPYNQPFSNSKSTVSSVIDMIREAAGQQEVTLTLVHKEIEDVMFSNTEDLDMTGLVLTTANSPHNLTINGGERVVKLTGMPNGHPLITVGSGVTLTLRNITFTGLDSNNIALVMVENGGTLTLEDGAVIEGNRNIWEVGLPEMRRRGGGVNLYGVLNMNAGEIRNNAAIGSEYGNGGGVHIMTTGVFTMNGGRIHGDSATIGGGVYINGGTFAMKGGHMENNTADDGGGVYIAKGTFRKTGGVIEDNNIASGVGRVANAFGGMKYRNLTAGQGVNLYFGPNDNINDGYQYFDLKDPEGMQGAGDTDTSWMPFSRPFSNSSAARGSVIDLVREVAGQPEITITLDPKAGEEVKLDDDTDVGASGLILRSSDSPDSLTIDGGGRVITLVGSVNGNPLVTVESGVTLTLRNITFKGLDDNKVALVVVKNGGKLVLENGAVIAGNRNVSGDGGGVYVDSGGVFNMTGGEISDNSAEHGGGVYVTKDGTFRKIGGAITGDNTASIVGKVAAAYDGGKFRDRVAGTTVNLYFGPHRIDGRYTDFDLIDPITGEDTDFKWLSPDLPFSNSNSITELRTSVIDVVRASIGQQQLVITLDSVKETVSFTDTTDIGMLGLVLRSNRTSDFNENSNNSPDHLIIDGSGRVIELTGTPSGHPLITVGKGVTLTLKNITFNGLKNNTIALFMVEEGGTLVLQESAVITNNANCWGGNVLVNKMGGGVNVAGGHLIMEGGKIRSNMAFGSGSNSSGGGVYLSSGTFTMIEGKIADNSASNGGGGVYVNIGTFTMEGGEISGNSADNGGGGGVYTTQSGTFRKVGGSITGSNTAKGNGSVAYAFNGAKYRDLEVGPDVNLFFGPDTDGGYLDGYSDFDLSDEKAGDTNPSWLPLSRPFSDETDKRGSSIIDLVRDSAGCRKIVLAMEWRSSEETVRFAAGTDFGVAGLTLTAASSPAKLTINGSGRIVTLDSMPSGHPFITVDSGVTLTLRNITFNGLNNNTVALIRVKNGGALILEEGAVIAGNRNVSSGGNGGGVYVDSGGTFNMAGGAISRNEAKTGGGVYVAQNGIFRKRGGVITVDNVASGVGSVVAAHCGVKYRDMAAGTDILLYFGPNKTANDNYPDFDLKDPINNNEDTEFRWMPLRLPFSNNANPNNSAIDWIRAVKGQLQATLPLDSIKEEKVRFIKGLDFGETGLTLTTASSSINLTIDGGRRVVALDGNNPDSIPLITVDSGVTLTLRNITFKGIGGSDGNTASVIRVKNGGTLILEEGAVITGNTNGGGGDGGGVCVDSGGTFNMVGGKISENKAKNGGGVYVAKGGTFRKTGGVIDGNSLVGDDGVGQMVTVFDRAKYRDQRADQDVKLYFGPDKDGGSDKYPDFDLSDPVAGMAGNTETAWRPIGMPFSGYSSVVDAIRANAGERRLDLQLMKEEEMVWMGVDDVESAGVVLTTENSPQHVTIDGGDRTINLTGANHLNAPLITVGKGVSLTLSGIIFRGLDVNDTVATVKDANNNSAPLFVVRDGGQLYLDNGTVIAHNINDNSDGGGVYVDSASELTMGIATEIAYTAANNGGGVYISGGKFTMSKGSIHNNEAGNSGGGVCIFKGGKFNMGEGRISDNKAIHYGGGVYMNDNGDNFFSIAGGTIEGNVATNRGGGGVAVEGGQFVIDVQGGYVINNKFEGGFGELGGGGGGGVFLSNPKTFFFMSGGVISGNEAKNSDGGGIYMNGKVSYVSIGGTSAINGNTASGRGGGIFMDGTLIMSYGSINGNTAGQEEGGGGVYVGSNSKFTLVAGAINGNNVTHINGRGGGVYVEGGSNFVMNDGSISGNTIARDTGPTYTDNGDPYPVRGVGSFYGCGVYVNTGGTFDKTGGTIHGLLVPQEPGQEDKGWVSDAFQSYYGFALHNDNGSKGYVCYIQWLTDGDGSCTDDNSDNGHVWPWPAKERGYAVYFAGEEGGRWCDRTVNGQLSTRDEAGWNDPGY